VSTTGTLGGNLFTLNLSTLPGETKRLITFTGLSTQLVNIADENFPAMLGLIIN
jgi:hypothetical protein